MLAVSFGKRFEALPKIQGLQNIRRALLVSGFVTALLLQATATVFAEPPGRAEGKGLRTVAVTTQRSSEFHLGSTFDRILTETASTNLYDPFTINSLKRMQAEAQPEWDPAGVNPDLTRHVAQRAFSIQAGRTLVNTLRKSDVRHVYYEVVDTFSSLQDAFRFSVKNNGSSLTLGKKGTGQKLIEFNVEFNMRQGLDPHLRFGRSTRLHYDTDLNAPMLEYGFAF